MATTSFDKSFVVSDQTSIKQLKSDFTNPRKVSIKARNVKAENEQGIQLLKQRLSNSVHC
ncbi:hypothetical protein [Psychromonas ossibalaenae]|uniref:hypothetical protein n=1 Tax=Psychromonas ossibalaenae TaxID=444922 RepID=UPI00037F4C11|nr:hypothetical protein [Psychromonas ossibalaenae]